ncbi:hypothetical protein [Nocardia carnea]|uniref:hypothetical protein n=1 Tax=Nocardia carnea TaxID=37328 RepID=UPI0024554F45|nr:hypothetical protein [Nocardia carnea]
MPDDDNSADVERIIENFHAFSAYEHAARMCQHLNEAALSVRAAYSAMQAIGDQQAGPSIEAARSAVDAAAAFATAIRLRYEAEYIDPST